MAAKNVKKTQDFVVLLAKDPEVRNIFAMLMFSTGIGLTIFGATFYATTQMKGA